MTSAPVDAATTIVIADAHPLCRRGIRAVLDEVAGFDVAGEAGCGSDALGQLRQHRPDLAVLDPGMAGLHGIASLRQIRQELPETQLVVFTSLRDTRFVRDAVAAGARAYVSKHAAPDCLLQALAAVRGGGFYADPSVAAALFLGGPEARGTGSGKASHRDLTAREQDVFRLIALGFTTKEVAAKLGVTIKSVETYRSRASEKLEIRSRAKIVQYGLQQGWFRTPIA